MLGVAAQFLAWRLRLPSILLLLLAGFAAGGFLDPDALLGDLLQPVVSLAVAVILFEGGLGLRFRDLRAHGRVVGRLVTVGVVITWAIGAAGAHLLLGLPLGLALLLGAILVVSGPTVILPLLRHVRPGHATATVLRWEGILIDPIGAILAAVVFDAVLLGGADPIGQTLLALGLTIGSGLLLGGVAAAAWTLVESRYWVPDFLAAPFGLALVILTFVGAEAVHAESGLFAVTFMGVALANQRRVSVRHLLDFKEDLSILLLGALFVLLAARLPMRTLGLVDGGMLLFLALLVLVARPLSVWVSTLGSALSWRERLFVAWMAPRGIVAAAVAAFFALRLEAAGVPQAEDFVPWTFIVIVGTAALYGLTARPLARVLRIAQPSTRGVLLVGANATSRALARVLQDEGFRALIVDTDAQSLTAARVDGLDAVRARILSTHLTEEVDLAGIGQLWAMTPDLETNSLAAVHFADEFGRARVFQVATGAPGDEEGPRLIHPHLRGRTLFGETVTYRVLRDRLAEGWTLRRTPITERFTMEDYTQRYGEAAVPLFVIDAERRLRPFTADSRPSPTPGATLVSLVRPEEE